MFHFYQTCLNRMICFNFYPIHSIQESFPFYFESYIHKNYNYQCYGYSMYHIMNIQSSKIGLYHFAIITLSKFDYWDYQKLYRTAGQKHPDGTRVTSSSVVCCVVVMTSCNSDPYPLLYSN